MKELPRPPAALPPPAPAPPLPGDEFQFPPIQRLMKRLGLRTHQGKGQHFLRRPEFGDRIAEAAGIAAGETVVEIGAGLGNISVALSRRARIVHAVEPDTRFQPWHASLGFFHKNLIFHYEDFLKSDVSAWVEPGTIPVAVGNLPYYLTSPILFHLLEGTQRWARIAVMVQREVADRMVASPGGKECGGLTLKVAYFTTPRIVLSVPPGEFYPAPQVHSRVVLLTPRPDPLGGDLERRRRVFSLIETAFQHRRKTLPNAVSGGGWWGEGRSPVEAAMHACGYDTRLRPETLALEDYFALERALFEAKPAPTE